MKKSFKFVSYVLQLITILLLGGGLLVSCNTFLEGSDFKEQLEKDIAYAKAPFHEIRVEYDEGSGSVITETILKKKVTDKFSIEFKLFSDYKFSGWKAYSKSSDGTLTELSSEYIKFSSYNMESSDRLFKTDVQFLKEVDGIIIKPECVKLPKIESITPLMESSGCDQDTAIIITFNKAVDKNSFAGFDCITLSSDGELLSDYFDAPYFSSDGKSLYITPLALYDDTKLLLAPNSSSSVRNILIEINFTGNEKDADGITLSGNIEHKYKVNKNYGNLKKVNMLIKAEEKYGSFLSAGEKECIVGYAIDLQFSVNKSDYCFVKLEAVSSKNENESRSDSVEITSIEVDSARGVYKYRVRVAPVAEGDQVPDDILIRPVCLELPKVKSYSPDSGEIPANAPVTVIFNKPMDESQFRYDSANISLTCGFDDVSDKFSAPVFNKEKTLLTLSPKGKEIFDYIKSKNAAFITVKISFSNKISVSNNIDGEIFTLPLTQDSKTTFNVKYKAEIETTAPSKFVLYATANSLSLQNAEELSDEKRFTQESIAEKHDFSDEEYNSKIMQNRTSGIVYIYGRYYDADTGVKSVTVSRKRTHAKDGNEVQEELCGETVYNFNCSSSENAEFASTDDGYTSFCLKYTIPDDSTKSDLGDGAIQLYVTVADGAGNLSEVQEFTAIKDNFVDLKDFDLVNIDSSKSWNVSDYANLQDFYERVLLPQTKHILLKQTELPTYGTLKNTKVPKDSVYIEYESFSGNVKEQMAWNEEDNLWEHNLNADKISGLDIKLYVKNEHGEENTKIFNAPEAPEWYKSVTSFISNSINKTKVEIYNLMRYRTKPNGYSSYYIYEANQKYFIHSGSVSGVETDATCRCFCSSDSGLCGDWGDLITGSLTNNQKGTFNSLDTYEIDEDKFTMKLYSSIWNKYTNVYCAASFMYKAFGSKILERGEQGGDAYWSSASALITKGDKTKIILNPYHDMKYYGCIDFVIYGVYPDGSYDLLNDRYTFGSNSEDKNEPLINNCSFLCGSDRYAAIEEDEIYEDLGNVLVLDISDCSVVTTDGKTKIYSSGIDRVEVCEDQGSAVDPYYYKLGAYPIESLKHTDSGTLFVPLAGAMGGTGTFKDNVKVIVYDKNGNSVTREKIPIHYNWGRKLSLSVNKETINIRYGDGRFIDIYATPSNPATYYIYSYVYKFTGGKWQLYRKDYNSVDYAASNLDYSINVDKNFWYKIFTDGRFRNCHGEVKPFANEVSYFYVGEESSGEHDLMLPSGSLSSNIRAISSDQPVLVETLATQCDCTKGECTTWDSAEWNFYARHVSQKVLNFSPSDYSPKRYSVPMDEIISGEKYCVIAHFANGEVLMSEVMEKKAE